MNAFDAQSPRPLPAPCQTRRVHPDPHARLQRVIDTLLNLLVPSDQPQVRRSQNRQGQPLWSVYDPVSHTTQVFASEEAVRIWLEQRYYC